MTEEHFWCGLWWWLEVSYLVIALLLPVAYCLREANDAMRRDRFYNGREGRDETLKNYLTYGHILSAIVLAIIPLINLCVLVDVAVELYKKAVESMNDKRVFKEPKNET